MKLISYTVNLTAVLSISLRLRLLFPILGGVYLFLYLLRLKFPMANDRTNLSSEVLLLLGFLIMLFNSISEFFLPVYFYYKIIGATVLFFLHFLIKWKFFQSNIKDCIVGIEDMNDESIFVKSITKMFIYLEKHRY